MTDETIRKKIEKIMALANQGVGGEKENAKKILDKILKKNGLSLDDFDSENKKTYWFKFNGIYQKKLINQICGNVIDENDYSVWGSRLKRNIIGFDLTKTQFIEISLRFDLYKKSLENGFDDFFRAFIIKNDIFPKSVAATEPTKEELDDHLRALQLASGIKVTRINKALEMRKP